MRRLKDIITVFPKSTIQASEDVEGDVPFYTSSQVLTKRCSFAIYPEHSITMGTGGMASVNYSDIPFSTSTDCFSFQIKDNRILTKYVYYYLYGYLDMINIKDFQGAGLKHLQKDRLLNYRINEANATEKLVNKLDVISKDIASLIELEKEQIEKLENYKKSLIFETVTRGIRMKSNFKKTNVEWFDEVPDDWKIVRIKDIFELRNDKTEETDINKVNLISLYTDKGVVQHSDLIETTGNKAITSEGYKIVRKNDIVVNIILCWMGAVGMSNFDGVTSPAYDIYAPKSKVNSKYYHYLFRTKKFNGECFRYGRGIMLMRWRTYSSEFSSIKVPYPNLDEQNLIVDYLDKKCLEIDELIDVKNEKINVLERYKKSLIYEYVTGKKEVC